MYNVQSVKSRYTPLSLIYLVKHFSGIFLYFFRQITFYIANTDIEFKYVANYGYWIYVIKISVIGNLTIFFFQKVNQSLYLLHKFNLTNLQINMN